MTEQEYRELMAAVRESGIPLPLQKELQSLIDKDLEEKERCKKLSPILDK